MNVPFYRPSLDQSEVQAVIETLGSGWLTTGPKTKAFEREFAAYLHHKHAVAVNSCTAALHLALDAIGLKAGEAVLVPTMTFAATAEVVDYFRARPLLVDCRACDFNLDLADAEQRLQAALRQGLKVVAIMPVHYAGQIGDSFGVQELARKYGLSIIEDAAHCCPAYYRDPVSGEWLTVGTGADLSCFSFYANKPITTGEGGMICTERQDYAERMQIMSLHGISRDAWKRFSSEGNWYYEIIASGYKYNLTDVAAAIGLCQLKKSDELLRKRNALAEQYTQLLSEVNELMLPQAQPDRIHSWHLYVIRLKLSSLTLDRAGVIEELKKSGIGTSVHYQPLHMHPFYRNTYGYKPEDLPCAATLYPEILTLPNFPDMTSDQVEYVCAQLKQVICRHRKNKPVSIGTVAPSAIS